MKRIELSFRRRFWLIIERYDGDRRYPRFAHSIVQVRRTRIDVWRLWPIVVCLVVVRAERTAQPSRAPARAPLPRGTTAKW